jgi:small GTP-binding protein
MSLISKKICLIGDFGVGKTSLVRRFVDRQFSDEYLSTLGVKISRKNVQLFAQNAESEQTLQLLIWDIEGSTKFKAIAPSYLQGAKAAIVVVDVTRQETIEHLVVHIQQFLSVNAQGFVIIALNKVDQISAADLAQLHGLIQLKDPAQSSRTYATSAKTGQNVDRIFSTVAQQLLQADGLCFEPVSIF